MLTHTWYHLVRSSASGFLKNPPTSAPLRVMPTRFSDSSIGSEALRWAQSPVLSPVHTAPNSAGQCHHCYTYLLTTAAAIARFSDSSIGSEALRWAQSPVLSPIHTAPNSTGQCRCYYFYLLTTCPITSLSEISIGCETSLQNYNPSTLLSAKQYQSMPALLLLSIIIKNG